MSDLINLKCPNCGQALNVNSTDIKAICTFCDSEILVKDFITERRIDSADRINTLLVMINNAVNANDFLKAYQYSEEICKLDSNKRNIAYLNYHGILANRINITYNILQLFYCLNPKEHRNLLQNIAKHIENQKYPELNRAYALPVESNRVWAVNQIESKYAPIENLVNSEIKKISVKICSCGNTLEYNENVCSKCGKSINKTSSNPTSYINTPIKNKKSFYKQWWFWVIIAVIVIFIGLCGSVGVRKSVSKKTTSTQATENIKNEINTEPTTETPTPPPTESKKAIKEKYQSSCKVIDFKELSRNPNKHKGEDFKFTGKVIQVQESSWNDKVELRINVTKNTYEYLDDEYWVDTIYATLEIPKDSDRILEDDIITIWGKCDGLYTYDSILGNQVTLPKIDVKYYIIND